MKLCKIQSQCGLWKTDEISIATHNGTLLAGHVCLVLDAERYEYMALVCGPNGAIGYVYKTNLVEL